jgi:uncharacterized peroxidase-related enzyme
MPRLTAVDPATAQGKAKALLDGVHKAFGMTPNMMRTMAAAPAVLAAYLDFEKALSGGALSNALREQIALALAGANRCDYCASAHTVLGKMAGIDAADLALNLSGRSADAKTEAALAFARAVNTSHGAVSDDDLARVRAAGYGDGEITEIVANVALNIFTNSINNVAKTVIDFPEVRAA